MSHQALTWAVDGSDEVSIHAPLSLRFRRYLPQSTWLRWARTLLVCSLIVPFGSCSRSPGLAERDIDPLRLPIAGSVKYKGQPASGLMITFQPLQPQTGGSGARVMDGAFEIQAIDGLRPGKYLVRFYDMAAYSGEPARDAAGNPLPAIHVGPQYSDKSTLTIEVKDGTQNQFSFDLR